MRVRSEIRNGDEMNPLAKPGSQRNAKKEKTKRGTRDLRSRNVLR